MRIINFFLIDDDPDEYELIEMALNDLEMAFQLTFCLNGLEAFRTFETIKNDPPDYIFIDLNMPYIDGLECLQKIKSTHSLQKSITVIYTNSNSRKDIAEAKEMRADHYLSKPIFFEDLVSILKSLFNEKQLPFVLNNM